jgi:cytochrome oxidase Cu insertion factor (SCO1/SenC/PrrC family)
MRKYQLVTVGLTAVLIAGGLTVTAYTLIRHDRSYSRPYGIPATVPDSQVNLMELSPVPVRPAPRFTLTDQDGRALSLSAFRGKVVVLEFMDPHCTDICPIVSDEFTDAYRDLGKLAGKVVFAAVNVNQYHSAVADVAAFSREHQLSSIPSWHFFTGSGPSLRAAWRNYNVAVQAPDPDADIVHSSVACPGTRSQRAPAPGVPSRSSGSTAGPVRRDDQASRHRAGFFTGPASPPLLPSRCPSPTPYSTWSSPRYRCPTGATGRRGLPRSAASWHQAPPWWWPTYARCGHSGP